jgi:4-diphosphocytidyl-2-C-methyl-D-erythritol kinase
VRLVASAPGKVNLCLFVGPRRADGRHELVTLLESVSIADEVSITAVVEPGPDEVRCPGVEGPNIVVRALEGLRMAGWQGPPVTIEIAKRVPVAAGMGGGSADAAATLRLAQQLHAGEDAQLQQLAAELGSDVPSQLNPGLALGTGAGDRVAHLEPLGPHAFVIVPLPYQLSAAAVYEEADRLGVARASVELERKHSEVVSALAQGAQLPDELTVNDLEPAAVSLYPPIASARDAVRDAGADRAIVSGSGPTVFGLFWGTSGCARAEAAVRALSERFPDARSAVAVDADFGHPRLSAQSRH